MALKGNYQHALVITDRKGRSRFPVCECGHSIFDPLTGDRFRCIMCKRIYKLEELEQQIFNAPD